MYKVHKNVKGGRQAGRRVGCEKKEGALGSGERWGQEKKRDKGKPVRSRKKREVCKQQEAATCRRVQASRIDCRIGEQIAANYSERWQNTAECKDM